MINRKQIKEAVAIYKMAQEAHKFLNKHIFRKLKPKRNIVIKNPGCFDLFIGQKNIVDSIKIFLTSSEAENSPMGHTLLHGPAGFGKSTIAKLISSSIDSRLHEFSGPMMTQARLIDLASNVEFGDVVFIDEIHAIPKNVEETLYEVMQDFSLEGSPIDKFTLIGATTRPGALLKPLRDRFMHSLRLQPYSDESLMSMIALVASDHKIRLTRGAGKAIVHASRGIPRLIKQYASTVFMSFEAMGFKHLTEEVAVEILRKTVGVHYDGLTSLDIEYLSYVNSRGGYCGIKSISKCLECSENDIIDAIEPYLIKCDLIDIGSSGRKITEKGKQRLSQN